MNDNKPFFEEPFAPTGTIPRPELEKEVVQWRNLFSWLVPEVKYWLTHVGKDVRLVRRDYHIISGVLGQPHFELKSLEVDTVEEERDYFKRKLNTDVKTVVISVTQLVDYEFVHEHTEQLVNERGEVIDELGKLMEEKDLV